MEQYRSMLAIAIEENNLLNASMAITKLKETNSIDLRDLKRNTGLIHAASKQRIEIVEMLIEAGANLELFGQHNWTALGGSYVYKLYDMADLLESHGASQETKCPSGWTILSIAAHLGYHEQTRRLLGRGADINTVDNNGWTPLMKAVGSNNPELATTLILAGADVTPRNRDGNNAINLAKGLEYTRLLLLLEEYKHKSKSDMSISVKECCDHVNSIV